MSQHIFTDNDLEVTAGWDRPLGYIFLFVEKPGSSKQVYNNLSDPDMGWYRPQDVHHYQSVLEKLGIAVPEGFWAAVNDDRIANMGNKVHFWSEVS